MEGNDAVRRGTVLALFAGLAGGGLVGGCAEGGEVEAAYVRVEEPAAGAPSVQPKEVLARMHAADLAEIQLAELARSRARTEEVRAYADRLERDHSFAARLVADLAGDLGFDVAAPGIAGGDRERPRVGMGPSEETPAPARAVEDQGGPHPRQVARTLAEAPPEGFDRAYLEAMVAMRERTIGELEDAAATLEIEGATSGGAGEVRDLAMDLLPILRQHRDLARLLLDDLHAGDLRTLGRPHEEAVEAVERGAEELRREAGEGARELGRETEEGGEEIEGSSDEATAGGG